MIRSFRIGPRLSVLVLVPLVVLTAIVTSAVLTFHKIGKGVDTIYEDRVVPLLMLKIIADDYAVLVIDAVNKANSGLIDAEDALDNIITAEQRIVETWNSYLATTLTDEEQQLTNEAKILFSNANQAIARVRVKLSTLQGNVAGELADYDGALYQQIDPISEQISRLIELQLQVAAEVRQEINALTDQAESAYIVSAVTAITVLLIVSLILIQSITRPLTELRTTMKRIEKHSDLSLRLNTDSKDELSDVAVAFNAMLSRIGSSLRQIIALSGTVTASATSLLESAQRTEASSNTQKAEIDQVAVAMNEMSATVQGIAENTIDAQQAAEESSETSTTGKCLAQENVGLITELSTAIDSATHQIESLAGMLHKPPISPKPTGSLHEFQVE